MNIRKSFACFLSATLLLASATTFAEEGGEEKPKKQPDKPLPDSAVSSVMNLPEVKAWKKWMEEHGHTLNVWGEAIKSINGDKCWEVGVGESDKDSTQTWSYFCVKQFGLDIWVENIDPTTGEIAYLPYETWRAQCKPLYNSPGKC